MTEKELATLAAHCHLTEFKRICKLGSLTEEQGTRLDQLITYLNVFVEAISNDEHFLKVAEDWVEDWRNHLNKKPLG